MKLSSEVMHVCCLVPPLCSCPVPLHINSRLHLSSLLFSATTKADKRLHHEARLHLQGSSYLVPCGVAQVPLHRPGSPLNLLSSHLTPLLNLTTNV